MDEKLQIDLGCCQLFASRSKQTANVAFNHQKQTDCRVHRNCKVMDTNKWDFGNAMIVCEASMLSLCVDVWQQHCFELNT